MHDCVGARLHLLQLVELETAPEGTLPVLAEGAVNLVQQVVGHHRRLHRAGILGQSNGRLLYVVDPSLAVTFATRQTVQLDQT